MTVVLRCRDCGAVMELDARTKAWPPCGSCGGSALELVTLASERIARLGDDDLDLWKDDYDAWKTREPQR